MPFSIGAPLEPSLYRLRLLNESICSGTVFAEPWLSVQAQLRGCRDFSETGFLGSGVNMLLA